jgi:hypothetical protein
MATEDALNVLTVDKLTLLILFQQELANQKVREKHNFFFLLGELY